MNKKASCCVFFFCCCFSIAKAQVTELQDSTFCKPAVEGLPRGKGVVIKREYISDYYIKTNSDVVDEQSLAEIKSNERWTFKIRAPLINKASLKVLMGLQYSFENHTFENTEILEPEFFKTLENKTFKTAGAKIYILKPWVGNKYFMMRLAGKFSGDFNKNFKTISHFSFSATPLLGWKKNNFTSMVFGINYSYRFDRSSVIPVISYNHTFNEKFGFESVLPINAKLRYSTIDKKNYFYLISEMNRSKYNFNSDYLINESGVFLKNSEIRFLLSYEREIHDWLWFGIEGGLRSNLNFELTNSLKKDREILVDSDLNHAFIAGFSIFLVPPKKFLK